MDRRNFIKLSGALALAGTAPARGFAASGKVKVGYLHTLAVDGQMWLAESKGIWKKHGLDLQFIQFQTGLELFQAMTGGSIDVLSTGAVVSNFPARGQGKVFLINNIEYATAQLWVRPEAGIKTLADLKGKQISTTTGTTAHVFLDRALRSVSLDPAKDVRIVNQRMSEAVTSFISGAVPAVALWSPFDTTVREKVPGALKVIDASAFFPQAAIVGGWAARNDFFEKNKPVLNKIRISRILEFARQLRRHADRVVDRSEQHRSSVAAELLTARSDANRAVEVEPDTRTLFTHWQAFVGRWGLP